MTSFGSGKRAFVRRVARKRHSHEPSPRSSMPGHLAQLRSRIEAQEADLLRSVLSVLEAEPRETGTFQDMREIERRDGLIYLGAIDPDGAVHYLPRREDLPGRIEAIVGKLSPEPLDTPEARAAIYELWLATRHTRRSAEDRDARLAIYAGRLAGYPADHARLILGELAETVVSFPPWADIRMRLVDLSGWRGRLTRALRHVDRRLAREATDISLKES